MLDPVLRYKSSSHYRELYEEHKARADTAEQERDQFHARVAELCEVVARSCVSSCNCLTKTPDVKYHESDCNYRIYHEILNRQPPQSLAAIEARVLRELVDEYVERVALNGSESERVYAITYGSISVRDISKKADRAEGKV